MFGKGKLMRDGVQTRALVLDKKVYASGVETGAAAACSYTLRVKFEDGSTTEITRRVWSRKHAFASVGDVIPVRYDPADRDKVEIDGDAMVAEEQARERQRKEQAVAHGERELG